MTRHSLGRIGIFVVTVFLAACGAALAAEVDPLDWPQWRGPEENGISRETGLVTDWDPAAKALTATCSGGATSSAASRTPIVMNGKLYTIVRADAGTNEGLREGRLRRRRHRQEDLGNKYNVFLSDVPAERIGWASCVGDPATGKLYAMGVCGFFQCLDGETGKPIWSVSLNEEYRLADHLRRTTHDAGAVRRPGDHQRRDHRLGRCGPADPSLSRLQQDRRRGGVVQRHAGRCPRTRPTARR